MPDLDAFHGCERRLAQAVANGSINLSPSTGPYEWLGHGIYFWIHSPTKAKQWVERKIKKGIFALGSVLFVKLRSGNCLNLFEENSQRDLKEACAILTEAMKICNVPMPTNRRFRNGIPIDRKLDCAVIEFVHALRRRANEPEYDYVLGGFQDGKPVYSGAGFFTQTHIQVAVRNTKIIHSPSILANIP